MEIFINGELNPEIFVVEIRNATHDLSDMLFAAVSSHSAVIESTHFLSVLARIPGGETSKKLLRLNLSVEKWERELADCAERALGGLPPERLAESNFHKNARDMLQTAKARSERDKLARITEPILLLAALQHATPPVQQLFEFAGIELKEWCDEIEHSLRPSATVEVFKGAKNDPARMVRQHLVVARSARSLAPEGHTALRTARRLTPVATGHTLLPCRRASRGFLRTTPARSWSRIEGPGAVTQVLIGGNGGR